MKKKIKDIYKIWRENPPATPTHKFLFWLAEVPYPVIEGNLSDFVMDYATESETYDGAFVHEYGDRYVDFDAETIEDLLEEWHCYVKQCLLLYIDSWARLYYALSIDYNPVFNVEEHTKNTYGQHETENKYGEDVTSDEYGRRETSVAYGSKTTTNGSRDNTTTEYSVSFDSATEKETGRVLDSLGSQTVTEGSHTDTTTGATYTDEHTRNERTDKTTSKQHIDQIDRTGNIGTVSAMDLLNREEAFRKKYAFFNNVFLILVEYMGGYYECDFIL